MGDHLSARINAVMKSLPYLTLQEQERLLRLLRSEVGKTRLTFLQWTKVNRRIRDKALNKTAQFSLRDYPWLEALYDLIGDIAPGIKIVIKKAAQIGATELAINLAFYVLHHFGSVFYALPPGKVQSSFAHARVNPAINVSPHILAETGDVDNVGLKTWANGHNLYIRSTSIPGGDPTKAAQLSEAPADMAVIDEFDRVPPAAVPLVLDRLGDSRLGWKFFLSTPTYPDYGIDAEYLDSTQHEAQVRCQICDQWQWLDWANVVGPDSTCAGARLLCVYCHNAIDRQGAWDKDQTGGARMRWQARKPHAATLGFWIPKLVSDRASLTELWYKKEKATKETDTQAFWNGDLGLAYEPAGSRLTRAVIGACAAHSSVYPDYLDGARWCAMGVDVGIELHYWIKDRVDGGRERTVALGTVLHWEDLDALMVRYGVQRCVVDDAPELREDVKFAARFPGKVWRGQEMDSPDAELATWNKTKGVVRIERTHGLDEARAKFDDGVDLLPAHWEVDDLVDQLCVSLRARRVRADGREVYHYPQTSRPDHYHHAKLFCEVAMLILPPDPGGESDRAVGDVPRAGGRRHTDHRGSVRGRL